MFCPNCGSQVDDGTRFCPNCGADMESSAENNDQNVQQTEAYTDYSSSSAVNDGGVIGGGGTNRNIAVCILLSIVTCGIYVIYWMYVLNEEINSISGDTEATGGGLVILFSIITCGIYSLYWVYKMGEKIDIIKNRMGIVSSSSGILYLILSIFGLEIVTYAIMQDTINKTVV